MPAARVERAVERHQRQVRRDVDADDGCRRAVDEELAQVTVDDVGGREDDPVGDYGTDTEARLGSIARVASMRTTSVATASSGRTLSASGADERRDRHERHSQGASPEDVPVHVMIRARRARAP